MTKFATTKEWEDEVLRQGTKQRFGLFSHPVGLTVGEDTYARPLKDRRDLKGSITLGPKNFYTKHKDKGFHGGVFARTGYISIGDDFKDFRGNNYLRDGRTYDNKMHTLDFKPSGATPKAQIYPHYKDYNDKKFDTRNQDGSVKTGQKNFTTAPMKKGAGNNGLFGRNLYALDPYERAEDLAREERLKHYNRVPAPFATTIHPKPTFDNQEKTFGGDDKMQPKRATKSIEPTVRHTKPWCPNNPAKHGYNKTLAPFQRHEPDPPRTPPEAMQGTAQHPRPWFPTHRYKTEPDPTDPQVKIA